MSYKALYRVYRPLSFNDIQDQEHISVTLMNIIKYDKISHAYLFAGPRGTGKTSIARIFAKAINCKFREQDVNPCNKCASCKAINEGRTLDIIEMDAASNNGVAEIRDLREKIKFLPTDSQYKIYIIDEVHMLSKGAFNALLKIMEEPPKHAIFILATTEASKIPITILSRVQRFNFHLIKDEVIKVHLQNIFNKEQIKYEPQAIDVIVSLARGSLRDALSISDQVSAYTNGNIKNEDLFKIFGVVTISQKLKIINLIANSNLKGSLKIVNNLIMDGANIKKLTEDLINILKDFIVYSITEKQSLLRILNREEINSLDLNIEQAYDYLDILITLLNELPKSDVPEQNITLAILSMLRNKKETTETNEVLPKPKVVEEDTDEFNTKEMLMVYKNDEVVQDNPDININDISEKYDDTQNADDDDDFENILNDFNTNIMPSNNESLDEQLNEQMEEINSKKKEVHKEWFSNDEILNLLVQFNNDKIDFIKKEQVKLSEYLIDDELKKYVEWLMSPSLKLASAGDDFILYVTNDLDLLNKINSKRRKKYFVKTINEVFNNDYVVYVVYLDHWYKIRDKFMELQSNNALPKPSPIQKAVEYTDEERYGEELFDKLFKNE